MLHELKRRIVDHIRMLRAIDRLRSYDDQTLADMGVCREEIADRVLGRR